MGSVTTGRKSKPSGEASTMTCEPSSKPYLSRRRACSGAVAGDSPQLGARELAQREVGWCSVHLLCPEQHQSSKGRASCVGFEAVRGESAPEPAPSEVEGAFEARPSLVPRFFCGKKGGEYANVRHELVALLSPSLSSVSGCSSGQTQSIAGGTRRGGASEHVCGPS